MLFTIDAEIFKQHPDLKIGAILIKGINNSKRVSAIESLLRGTCAQLQRRLKDKDIYDEPMVQVWAQAYGRFGINPKKYPPSIAALLKRIQGGKEIPHVNLLVDLYNYFSLKYLLPIGGEDMDWLCGDLKLTFTKGGEPFRPIGSIHVETAKEGEAAYLDNGGITCRYWNYRECERSKFTPKTVNALLLIEDLSKMHIDQFGQILREMQETIMKYIGGQIEPYILNEEKTSIDLGIEGRRNTDDFKVPQQEIVHYNAQRQAREEAKVLATSPPTSVRSIPGDYSEPENTKFPAEPASIKKKILKSAKSPRKSPKTQLSNPGKRKSSQAPTSPLSSKKLQLNSPDFPREKIKKLTEEALKKAFPKAPNVQIDIEYPASAEHGDYSANVALKLSKELQKNPREIAEKIIAEIAPNASIEKVEIAGPGFINFFLSEQSLKTELQKILEEKEKYGFTNIGEDKNIVVEYSQPNIAKPLGVHHLLSTIIGQSLYNIFKQLGFHAISVNHIGDWGTQFGKLTVAFKKWGNRTEVEKDPINEFLKLYVKFHEEAEKNSALDDEAREEFRKFEEGDEENFKLWQWFVDESMKDVQKTYDELGGIHFDYNHGESFYQDKMQPIIEDGIKKGVFETGEEGALVMHLDEENLPTVPIQKKDGATLYITRDFAALKYRIETWNPEKILYVVDMAQTLHFKQFFAGATKLGWHHGQGEHVWFGRMRMKDKSMSTRKGNIILLNEVLDEAIKRAKAVIEEKNADLPNKEKAAHVIGVGAIKYNILSQNRTTDITFDWDNMLSFDGNSAPYLQYTYARAKSILKRKEESIEEKIQDPEATEEKTNALLKLFPKFSEQIASAAEEYKPNILANYLYDLAQKFNAFYNTAPVLKAKNEEQKTERLKIVEATAQILKNGLALLGIQVIEEM